jgi:indolepyruvate ferredoxin oxidoreductase
LADAARGGAGTVARAEGAENLPDPPIALTDRPYGILVTGVGGTGVVTIGALLGTAATLEGKGASVLDMAGLAQKGGPVWSHVRIAARQDMLHASRIAAGEANLLLGCDVVVAVADESLAKLRPGATRAVVNSDFSITSDFVRTFAAQARTGDVAQVRDPVFPADAMEGRIAEAVGPGDADFVPGTRLATALLGDSIATNLFMVGYACQKGLLPVSAASILRAVEMNGAAVEMNKGAFLWGRRAALDLGAVERVAAPPASVPDHRRLSTTLDEAVARRVEDLTAYGGARYARRYADLVSRVRAAEAERTPGRTGLADAVARGHYKLLAVKDEYEVARLYTETGFLQRLNDAFEGGYTLNFHLAPPLWARRDPATGEPRKRAFGPWMLRVFTVLARLRRLRGTALDPFRFTEDRKLDRRLLDEYERLVGELVSSLRPDNHDLAVELASLPDGVRGFGHVRKRHADHAKRREAALLDDFRGRGERRGGGDEERVPDAPVVMAG